MRPFAHVEDSPTHKNTEKQKKQTKKQAEKDAIAASEHEYQQNLEREAAQQPKRSTRRTNMSGTEATLGAQGPEQDSQEEITGHENREESEGSEIWGECLETLTRCR